MKNSGNKKTFKVAGLAGLGAILTAGAVLIANGQSISSGDEKALVAIRDAYQAAMNSAGNAGSNSVSEFAQRYLDASFRGTMMTDTEVKSPADFLAFTDKMKALIGLPKGKYEIKEINTLARFAAGNTAVSVGTTKESVQAAALDPKTGRTIMGQPLSYNTMWTAVLSKDSGSWKIVWAHSKVTSGDISDGKMKEIKELAAKANAPAKGG